MPSKIRDAHYPSPWTGRLIVGGLGALFLALLTFAVLRPDATSQRTADGLASVVQMDASQVRADNAREADRARTIVP